MPVRDSIVEIAEESNGNLAVRLFRCRLDDANVEYPNGRKFFPFNINPATLPPLDTSANVEDYGNRIRAALANHPAIAAELAQIFQAQHRAMLHFWIGPPQGECYRWETLCQSAPLNFLGLRDLCTVTRLADISSDGSDVRAFSRPIRMAAFLSPIKVPAKDEFDGLTGQVSAAREAGLEIECKVYVGEQELLDKAEAYILAGKLPGITVAPIPFDTINLDQTLRKNPVELLHFFCHGHSAAGVQALELATISDNEAERNAGTVLLSIERLNEILNKTEATWVTVLNACCGGLAVPSLHSMALALARRGSPIAIGMAEPITHVDATIFSRAFYEELFLILRTQVGGAAPGTSVLLDLAPAVVSARRMVFNQYQSTPPDAYGRWALPLFYERVDPLIVQPVEIDEPMKLRINTVAGILKHLPDGAPDQMRDDLLALLDKAPRVPMTLRPNRYGLVSPTGD
jgi:hypothetical protein